MRLSFPNQTRFDLMGLHAALMACNIPGVSGVSTDYDMLHIEIPLRDRVTDDELAAIKAIVDRCIAVPDWDEARRKRIGMLSEADWRISKAEDNGERQEELRAYRQALRDITKQSDPANVIWPVKPWGSV